MAILKITDTFLEAFKNKLVKSTLGLKVKDVSIVSSQLRPEFIR